MKKLVLTISILVFVMWNALAQTADFDVDKAPTLKLNSIQGELGYLLLGGSATLTYERVLKESTNVLWTGNATYGGWVFWDAGGKYYGTSLGLITNKSGGSHLDVKLGLVSLAQENSYEILPEVHLGYRFQKPDKHFIFRIGLGIPNFINLSFGYAF